MKTVIETPTFQKQAEKIWTEDERLDFIAWLSSHPLAGDVIPGADGARKVRWNLKSTGKRGGVRIVYFNMADDGIIYLVAIYKKNHQENISPNDIKKAKK